MNKHLDLLDTPLEEAPRKTGHGSNIWDYYANCILVATPLLLLVIGVVPGLQGSWFFAALSMLALGAYQLLSAFVGGFNGNKAKGRYGLIAVGYVLFLIACLGPIADAVSASNDLIWLINGFFIFIAPGIGAIYFTLLCRSAMLRES